MSLLRRLFGFGAPRREAAGQPPAPPPAGPAARVPVHAVGDNTGDMAEALLSEGALALRGASAGLTPRDLGRLRGVHPDLVRVVIRARTMAPFIVAEGLRSPERQAELVAQGRSRTMASRHLTGHAVDLYPITDRPIPSLRLEDYREVADAMRDAARAEGVALTRGYDWGWDAPHYELPRSRYP